MEFDLKKIDKYLDDNNREINKARQQQIEQAKKVQQLIELQEAMYPSKPKENKTVLGTVGGGLQLLGQATLRGLEGLFIDLPTATAAGAHYLFGGEKGKQKYEDMMDFVSWDLTNMAINKLGGQESNPYITKNTNLYNKEYLNPTSYVTDENLGGKIIQAGGQLLTGGALSGGLKAPMLLYNAATSYSGGTSQAMMEGADAYDASLYGLGSAGVTVLLDALTPNTPGVNSGVGKLTTKDAAKYLLKNVIEEGLEEGAEQLVDPLLQMTYKGTDSLRQYGEREYWNDVVESMIVGGILGGAFKIPETYTGLKANNRPKAKVSSTKPKSEIPSLPQTNIPETLTPSAGVVNKVEDVKSVPTGSTQISTEGKLTNVDVKTNSEIASQNNKKLSSTQQQMKNIEGTKKTNSDGVEYTVPKELYRGEGAKVTQSGAKGLNRYGEGTYLTTDSNRAKSYGEVTTHTDMEEYFQNPYIQGTKYNQKMVDELTSYVATHPEAKQSIDMVLNNGFALTETMIPAAELKKMYLRSGYDSFIGGSSSHPEYLSFKMGETNKDVKTASNPRILVKDASSDASKESTKTSNTNFKAIEESYNKANKYTGEIKTELLKNVQKEYNKYRDAGGDKTIAALEDNYQAKQKIATALNKEVTQKNKYTADQARVSKMKAESLINKYQKTIDSKSTKTAKLAEMKQIVDKYMDDVSKGMEPIEQYEKWKNEVEIHESANKTIDTEQITTTQNDIEPKETEVMVEAAKINTESATGNGVVDEELNIDADGIDDILDEIEILEIELGEPPTNARFNKVYNEQQKTLAKKGTSGDKLLEKLQDALIAKGKLDKKYAEKGGTAVIQWLVDDQYSLRRIDKQNKNNKIANAMRQRNKALVLANASINGENLIDVNFKPTDIPSVSKAWKPLTDLPVDTQAVGYEYIVLQQEYFHKINNELYDIPHEDNIFKAYTNDDIVQRVTQIEDTYPELVNLIKKDVMPNVRKIVYKMNQMEIETDTRNAKTEITKDFAINEMNMSEADIKAHTVGKKILVDTADFYMAANPWYIPIERELVKTHSGEGSKAQSAISKPKTRKADADQAIQPLAEGMAEKIAKRYVNMKNNQARQAIAENWSNITENKIITYKKTDGKLGHITTNGEGEIQMTYLANNDKGELVNKTINITKNMERAYNGFDENIQAFRETKLGKALQYKSRIQRNLLTKWNLPWQEANVMRDVSDALINNEFDIKGNGGFIKNVFGAYMIDAANNTETFQEFSAYKGTYLTQNEATGYLDNKTGLSKVLGKADNILEMGELMTRYALYKTAREAGYSIEEAQRVSDEGTTDFSKSGSIWKLADGLGITVFLSPSVAGINRFIDTTITPYANAVGVLSNKIKQDGLKLPSKQSYDAYDKKVLKRAGTQLIKTSLIFGLGRELLRKLFDDEESQKQIANLSDTEIQNNVIIPINGGVIKIPKGRIWRAYDAISDLVSDDTIRDEDKMDVVKTAFYVWDSVGINGIDSSTTFSNFMSILKNEDYYGNEIYSDSGISKETFDYLLKQYGSIYYKTFQYVNGGTDKNPWVSNFYTDTTTVSSYNNRFYNMKDAYSTTYDKSVGAFKSDADMQNYFAYRVINYEKSNGELSVELAKLKALKEDSTSTAEEIRQQEARVQAIYQDIFSYIDSNTAVDYSTGAKGSVIRYGTKYRFTKNKDGSYTKDRK